jgi:hypothetical protein
MTPAKLPDLVVNNEDIAIELLVCMNITTDMSEYCDVLCQMKLSTSLLKVFFSLSHSIEFPKEFTHLFVKNCMYQCSCQSKDNKAYKGRMVRIMLVFLKNILKQKFISYEDISVDLKYFCLEHNSIEDAQDMLKKVISEKSFKYEVNKGESADETDN